jgi:hypothetical protein
MPVKAVKRQGKTVGYKWGTTGKVYPTRAQAQRQARAIYASGYKKKR